MNDKADCQTTDRLIVTLVEAWHERAKYYRRQMDGMNRGRCHDGNRQFLRGMAAMADTCADDLADRLRRIKEGQPK